MFGKKSPEKARIFTELTVIALMLALLSLTGCNRFRQSGREEERRQSGLEEKWGVRVEGVRLSAGGYMLDFRYRILDPDKAVALTKPGKETPYLIDQASGVKFLVPVSPKIGALRQTTRNSKPAVGRVYFIIFANPAQYVKAGNKVTVGVGDFQAQDITVQ